MLQGWRSENKDELAEKFVIQSSPCKEMTARERRIFEAGYLSALYTLKNEALPRAYVRTADTAEFQAAVGMAIAKITEG